MTKRASPSAFIEFKCAKLLVNICNNVLPFDLFHVILSQSMVKRRAEYFPKFFDVSRTKVGHQSFPHRLQCASKIKFDYYGIAMNPKTV